MYQQLGIILTDILIITKSTEDKDSFVDRFLQLCRQYAVVSLVQQLPQDQQKELHKKLETVTTGEEGKHIILQYLSQEKYEAMLEQQSKELFQEYIDSIMPTVSQETQAQLKEYLKTIEK